ncbi:MAG: type II toxin-antitoxin system VapC family toxin [Candidatus Ranarchaeia archaeon]
MHISTLILLEVGNALHEYNLKGDVENKINAIISLPITVHQIDSSVIKDALRIYAQNDVDIYDCVHAAVMLQMDLTVISADRDFNKIPWMSRIGLLEYSL